MLYFPFSERPPFKAGMRWPDYLAGYDPAWHPYVEAIRLAIIEGQVWAEGIGTRTARRACR